MFRVMCSILLTDCTSATLHQSKVCACLHIAPHCGCLHCFAGIPLGSLGVQGAQIRRLILRVRVDWGRRKYYKSKFSPYSYLTPVMHRFGAMHICHLETDGHIGTVLVAIGDHTPLAFRLKIEKRLGMSEDFQISRLWWCGCYGPKYIYHICRIHFDKVTHYVFAPVVQNFCPNIGANKTEAIKVAEQQNE